MYYKANSHTPQTCSQRAKSADVDNVRGQKKPKSTKKQATKSLGTVHACHFYFCADFLLLYIPLPLNRSQQNFCRYQAYLAAVKHINIIK